MSNFSVLTCGNSCLPCSNPTGGGQATCDGTACGISCDSGYPACGQNCGSPSDASNCGPTCQVCTPPLHGSALCSSGTCDFSCTAPFIKSGNACSPPPPRPVAPLSGALTSSRHPVLRWSNAQGFSIVHVEVCADRACSTVLWLTDLAGTSAVVTNTLPPGVMFWRAASVDDTTGAAGTVYSPTWEFMVQGTHSAPVFSSWGTITDFNGDGLADVIVDYTDPNAPPNLSTYAGGSTFPLPLVGSWNQSTNAVGDFNGDGFPDVVDTASAQPALHAGGAAGLSQSGVPIQGLPAFWYPGPTATTVMNAGDVNGDGYPDLMGAAAASYDIYVIPGGPGGLQPANRQTLNVGTSINPLGFVGNIDINADGYSDMVLGDPAWSGNVGRLSVYLGSPGGLSAVPTQIISAPPLTHPGFGWQVTAIGDVDGDGYADIAVSESVDEFFTYHGSAAGLGTVPVLSLPMPYLAQYAAQGGDLNGDGYSDLLVQTQVAIQSSLYPRTLVLPGSPTGIMPTSIVSIPLDARYGGGVGDINGDGVGDLVLGSYTVTGIPFTSVYTGSAGTIAITPVQTMTPGLPACTEL